jgi:hypothetical protein
MHLAPFDSVIVGRVISEIPSTASFKDYYSPKYLADVRLYSIEPRFSGAWEGYPYYKFNPIAHRVINNGDPLI